MLVQLLAVSLLLGLRAAATPFRLQSALRTHDDDCPKGVHIVGVRGTLEDSGFGAMQDIVDQLLTKLPGADTYAINYPASGISIGDDEKPIYNFFQYRASEAEGLSKLTAHLEDFALHCPDSPIVLMGYSQGAHIVGDSLCGVRGGLFQPMPPLDYYFTQSIMAIIQLGDPTNVGGLPWHRGNGTNGGIFPRQNFDACSDLGSKWQSYCDATDFFCERGQSIEVHLGYVKRYRDDIVDFIVNQVGGPQTHGFKYLTTKNGEL